MGKQFIGNVKGVGIKAIYKQYYASRKPNELIGGTWVDEVPLVKTGTYLWSRWKIELTNNLVEHTTPLAEGIAGSQLETLGESLSSALQSIIDVETKADNTEQKVSQIAPEGIVDIQHGGTGTDSINDFLETFGFGTLALKNVASVEEGGTGAETAEQARKNLKVFEMSILWENPDPTQPYALKNLSLPIENQSFIALIASTGTTNPNRLMPLAICPNIVDMQATVISQETIRTITVVSSEEVQIGGAANGNNSLLIPRYILGIANTQSNV